LYIYDKMTKNIEIMTIPSVELGYINNPKLPILSFKKDVFETQCAEKHAHPRAQLIYSTNGIMRVTVDNCVWLVTSKQAIWVPSEYTHHVSFLKKNEIRNLFIDTSVAIDLPKECFALDVSSFLRELIIKTISFGNDYSLDTSQGRIISVLLDELKKIKPTKCFLPISNEIHIKKVMNELIKNPSDKRTIEELASLACTTSRTLSRLFVKEVGMTFGDWRKQIRIMEAIEKLEKGIPIAQISLDLGYNNPSSFIEMFRKEFGVSPSKYLKI
jgi:AraC-like DNA-binding protein